MAEEADEHLLNLVKKIAEEQNFKNFETKITPVSTHGANYTSILFKVKITGEGRDLDLFAKVAALKENARAQAEFNPFDVENEFYTYLVKTYRQLEDKHGVSEKYKMTFPVYYGAETTQLREILILEDITSRGFDSANRFESVDWSYASAAITELAKLHALSLAFQHESPDDFNKYISKAAAGILEDNTIIEPLFKAGIASALGAVREENKDKLSAFLSNPNIVKEFMGFYKPVNCKVLIHSDYRPSNMMHKVLGDGSTEVIPVDYQSLLPSSPVIDLLYFIFTATDGPFREKYYQKLIDHYYLELGVSLARLGLNVTQTFPRDLFEAELKEKLPYGLLMIIGFLPVLVVPEDEAPTVGDDFSNLAVNATSDLYARRLNEVIDNYVTWGVLGNEVETVTAEEHLLNFAKKIAKEQNFENFDIKITPVSTKGANYTSTLFKIKITGDGRDLDVFAKVAALHESMRSQAPFDPFEIENDFYTNLVKIYRQLEDKSAVPDKDRLKFPVYYGADTTHLREILILEDLTSRGFGSANRFESVDWPYASAAITELAKFHALSVAFQHEHPTDFDKFIAKTPTSIFDGNPAAEGIFQSGVASALAVVREENKDKLNAFFSFPDFMKTFNELYKPVNCKVIIHSDFRPNNMLHQVMGDGSTEVIPVDYQTMILGSPIIDLLYFIFTGTDGPFRANYYHKLVNHYYSEFGVALGRLGFNIEQTFPRQVFESELKEKLPYGLLLSVGMLPVLVVPEDQAPAIGDDFSSFAVNASSDLYTRRLNEVVDDYVTFGVLGNSINKTEKTISAEEHLLNFAKKIAKEQNFESFDIKITPVSTKGANYTSTLFKIKITGDGRDLDVFAKVAALHESIRSQAPFDPFEIENDFYTNLVKIYRQLEDKSAVPDKDRLKFPVYYGADTTHLREILVLEDLTSRGFGSANRFESVDWPYASAAITELAKFHALSVAFQHEHPTDFDKFIAKTPTSIYEGNPFAEAIFQSGLTSALAVVREENKDKLNAFFSIPDIIKTFNDLYKPVNCKVIMHSDFRPNNMLHQVMGDGSTEVIPVDYQTMILGSPIIDLLYFIFTGTDGPFRANYYHKLINHYYSEFGVALRRLGFNIEQTFSREVFEAELKEKLPYGLFLSVGFLPVLVVPEDEAPTIGDDMSSFAVKANSDLYARRLNEAVDDYVTFGVLDNSGKTEEAISAEDHLLNFAKKIAKEQNFEDFDIKITPVSTNGANYSSILFKIKITGAGRDLDVFAKVAALNENVRGQTHFDPFDIENEFYTNLVKTYKRLEEKHGVADKDKLKIPVFYGAETTRLREILVLEDLTSRGFGSANRFESVDWPYASAAITELAKFHALSIAYQHECPDDFVKFTAKTPGSIFEDNASLEPLVQSGIASALAAVREENKDKLNAFVTSQDLMKSFNDLFKIVNCKVLMHTDFRPSNMLHKVINDGNTEVILVDYQTIVPGSPVIDLLNFVFTATDGPFRAKYYQKLIDHYYTEFSLSLARLGQNVEQTFSREHFESELKEKLPYGLIQSIGFLPVLLVPEDEAPVIGDDFANLAVNATSDLYARRLNEVIDDYVTWGVLGKDTTASAEEHLQNFVNKIAKEQNFKSFDTKIIPVSTHGANYTSTLFKIRITGEGRELAVFAKVCLLSENMRIQMKFDPFRIENIFYTYLIKVYKQLEEKHGVTEAHRLKCPVFYGAENTHLREILALEDLTSRGFVLANRFNSVDWSYASAAITELAKFHALSVAFQHESPEEFDEFIERTPPMPFDDSPGAEFIFRKGVESALAVVRKENKAKLSDFLNNEDIMKTFGNMIKPVNCKVILHADFRPSNMLYKVLDDGSTEVIPVDYQTYQPGSPIIDLLNFIFTATDGPFRAKYYQKLIDHYYSELGLVLARLGLNIAQTFSRELFESELKEKLPCGLIMSMALLPVLLVPENEAPEISNDFTNMAVVPTTDLYAQRLNELVDDYVTWGVLTSSENIQIQRAMTDKTVSADEHLLNFIKKIATEQNFNNFETKIIPVSTHGANYTSTLFKIKITGEGRDLDLFAKVAALNENIRVQSKFDPFDIENEFYINLVKFYRHLEKKHGVSNKDKLKVPDFYGAETSHLREILVLEDLTSRGFGSANRFESVDWSYASAAVTELAKFHALSIAFQYESPDEFDKFITKVPGRLFDESMGLEPMFEKNIETAVAAARKENKDKLNVFLRSRNVLESFNELLQPVNCKVILHNDFRPNNMLHKVNKDGTSEVISVDYQTIQQGSPVIDLLYFIFTATDGPFRAKYYQKLVNLYHSELGVALARLGLNIAHILPRKDFEAELKEKLHYGLLVTIMILPLLVVPEDMAPVIGDDFASLAVNATSDLYARRLNEVVDDYVAWGVLGKKNKSCFGKLFTR